VSCPAGKMPEDGGCAVSSSSCPKGDESDEVSCVPSPAIALPASITDEMAQQGCVGIGGLNTPTGYDQASWGGCSGITHIQTYGVACVRVAIEGQWVWTPACLPLAAEHSTQPSTGWYVPVNNQ
jgi:hypothetical protein